MSTSAFNFTVLMLVVHHFQSRALTIPRQCLLPLLDRDADAADSQLGLFPVSFPLIDTPGNRCPFLASQAFAEAPLLELSFILSSTIMEISTGEEKNDRGHLLRSEVMFLHLLHDLLRL